MNGSAREERYKRVAKGRTL